MATASLSQEPDLDQLRNQARELQRAVRSGTSTALARVARLHPNPPDPESFTLTAAQLVLAREYGFPSWARLRRYVGIVTAGSWNPDATPPPDEPVADRFLRLACLTYSDDAAADQAAAAALLAEHPGLPSHSLAVAAACADVGEVDRFLAADPALAAAPAGPYGWAPLLYQAYARHDPRVSRESTVRTARALLAAGADPNDGRFWHGLPTPFTVLTGVLGHGEHGEPWHPQSLAFARVLLDAGADPNDGQAIYNRMFSSNDDHLVLLFEYGLGKDTGGPWYRLLGESLEPPAVLLRALLWWAVTHDQRQRVALLAEHGVDVVTRFTEVRYPDGNGRTPVEVAVINGKRELADQLRALGAGKPRLRPAEEFVAAVLAGDAEAVRATDPAVVEEVRRTRTGLLTWAAAQGAPNSVQLLVAAGFDVNALGRGDAPIDNPWYTALHNAAADGNLTLARTLLDLGADPDIRDKHYDATPLGYARHFNQTAMIDLLQRHTHEQ